MVDHPALTHDRLREVLEYFPVTGMFVWLVSRGTAKAGEIAGAPNNLGYRSIGIDGITHKEHRLAYLFMNGKWPENEIDHINFLKSDNSWINLRPATASQNQWNRKKYSRNTSGHKGVYWHRASGKWSAAVRVDKIPYHLGLYESLDEAAAAYKVASERYFGEFARVA